MDCESRRKSRIHGDMLQMHSATDTWPSKNILIARNRFLIGNGTWAQSIFMANEAATTKGPYVNIAIEDNEIENCHLHGATVGETDGLTITGNVFRRKITDDLETQRYVRQYGANGGIMFPRINLIPKSKNVTVTGNTPPAGIPGPFIDGAGSGAGWIVQ